MPLAELASLLYEDKPEKLSKSNIRVVNYRLRRILREYGCENLLVHRRGVYAVDVRLFECDSYELLKGNGKFLTCLLYTSEPGEITAIGLGRKMNLKDAVFLNGLNGHELDFDDGTNI